MNVKSIPKNFGAYDFQPTYLEKHFKGEVDLGELAESIVSNLARELGD